MAVLPGATPDDIRLLNEGKVWTVGDLQEADLDSLRQVLEELDASGDFGEQTLSLEQLNEWQQYIGLQQFSFQEELEAASGAGPRDLGRTPDRGTGRDAGAQEERTRPGSKGGTDISKRGNERGMGEGLEGDPGTRRRRMREGLDEAADDNLEGDIGTRRER